MIRQASISLCATAVGALCAAGLMLGCSSAGAEGSSSPGSTHAGNTVAGTSIGATTVGAGTSPGARNEQTHPTVSPSRGITSTRFVLALRSRHDLGAHRVRYRDYRVTIRLRSARAAVGTCGSSRTVVLTRGASGQRLKLFLRPGRNGWCRGQYLGSVMFESGPNCPKPTGSTVPTACPRFASQRIPAGRFVFSVH
jgi:hypothetical protein